MNPETPLPRSEGASDPRSSGTALLSVVGAGFVPWSLQVYTVGDLTFVFPFGLVNTAPPQLTTVYHFLFVYTAGLPGYILAWPASVLLWVGSLASAGIGLTTGREDPRLTGGLLVLAGVAQLSLAWGFSIQLGRVAYPMGTALLWAIAWWHYWPAVRARVFGER